MPDANQSGLGAHRPASDRLDPPESFVEQANVADPAVYREFAEHWPGAWERAADLLEWDRQYDSALADEAGFSWFDGGRLNACHNCVDRHLDERKNQLALAWEGRDGGSRTYTYLELFHEVNEFAAALRGLGVEEGDVVTMYMPMILELPVAMLACARLGAPHSVVYAGLAADALATRMNAADSEYLVTCDGYYRRGDAVWLKNKAETAGITVDGDVTLVVVDRLEGHDCSLGGDDHDYDALVAASRGERVDPVTRASSDELFVIYTSGTTGTPRKVTHTTGGYLSYVAWTAHAVLDIKPEDTYWCSADIGWITGHSYVVYGPLALGTTSVLYEGEPDHPGKTRLWEIIERNAVDVFYTAPTAIRAFMKWGEEHPAQHDLSSLRLLGTVGEPINPRAWKWYYKHIGNEECPIVDTWWQTETGGMKVTTLPAIRTMQPGSAGPPLPGVSADVVDNSGDPVGAGRAGYLVVNRPWPGMLRTLYKNDERFINEYWDEYSVPERDQWVYFPEDGAKLDEEGYITILGRVDDVLNVSGHRLGTMEIESAIVGVEGVAEAAVVGGDHEMKGEAVYAYVITEEGQDGDEALRSEVVEAVEDAIGPIARPEAVVFTHELPKTRSGKIMRRLLEDIANEDELGDTSTLRNPDVVSDIQQKVQAD